MSERSRRYVELFLVAGGTAILTGAAPAVASTVRHALFADNAGKVDHKDAVRASASIAVRRGKLVATSSRTGRLPNNIIAVAPDAANLGGKPPSAYALETEVQALQSRVATLENKLQAVSYDAATKVLRITGANLQIVDGTGTTDGAPNGLGNLIIGYNEDAASPLTRTGSHNLVVGVGNSYSSYGGIVAGASNTVSGPYASVTGG